MRRRGKRGVSGKERDVARQLLLFVFVGHPSHVGRMMRCLDYGKKGEGMEIRECIGRVDHVKPNQYGIEEKVGWLSYLDGTIWNDIIQTHEGAPEGEFEPYDPEDIGRGLLVGYPYDELYCAYLKMKIDEANGETGRYNNSAVMFNAHLQEFAKYYNRTHLPLDGGRFRIL